MILSKIVSAIGIRIVGLWSILSGTDKHIKQLRPTSEIFEEIQLLRELVGEENFDTVRKHLLEKAGADNQILLPMLKAENTHIIIMGFEPGRYKKDA